MPEKNGWEEYRKLVISSIEDLKKCQTDLEKKFGEGQNALYKKINDIFEKLDEKQDKLILKVNDHTKEIEGLITDNKSIIDKMIGYDKFNRFFVYSILVISLGILTVSGILIAKAL